MIIEKLHNARLERERIIEGQQLEQRTPPNKETQQNDKARSHSITLPTPVKASMMTNDVLKESKTVNNRRERFTKSATLPMSNVCQSGTRLPSAVMSLPEKVTPSLCNNS